MDKPKEDIFKTIMEIPDNHSVPTAKLHLHPKEDTEWQACQEAGENPFEQKEEDNPFKKTLDSIVLGAYEQGKKDALSSVVERIEKVKESVQKQTGSFKYDDCYDDCIKIIKEIK